MTTNFNSKKFVSWVVVSLLSASSRVLETVSMILPVKAIFVLMKPDVLPDFWFELGLTLYHLMSLIIFLVMFSLVLARVLHVVARRKAHQLHGGDGNHKSERQALITTNILAAIIVMVIFAVVIGFINSLALLLIGMLIAISQIKLSFLKKIHVHNLFALLGISKEETRIRFVSQLLFLTYFMCLLIITAQQNMDVSITLLLVMLVGRRFFGEFTRFQKALLRRKNVRSANWDDE